MTASHRRRHICLVLIVAVSAIMLSAGALAMRESEAFGSTPDMGYAWAEPRQESQPGEYLVRFSHSVATEESVSILQDVGMEVVKDIYFKPSREYPEGLTIYLVKAEDRIHASSAVETLSAHRAVEYVAPNDMVYPANTPSVTQVIPNDRWFPDQWGFHNIGQKFLGDLYGTPNSDIDAPEAWAIRHDAPEIVVAVLDTGIQIDHPDLAANIWVNEAELNGEPGVDDDGNGYVDDVYGWNFFDNDNIVYHPGTNQYHGTHVSGIIGAVADNEIGVAGVAWNVKIMPLRFIGDHGGPISAAIEAIAYAWNNGAHITNNSWGTISRPNEALEDAMRAAAILHVCAAGNAGMDNDERFPGYTHYPSSYDLDNIIAVAASDWNDDLCAFSHYGATTVDIAAPGERILSTIPTDVAKSGYAYIGGTSMATPHVSGALALVLAHYPDMPLYPGAEGHIEGEMTIKDLLLATVEKKSAFADKMVSGGRLNVHNALMKAVPPIIDMFSADPTFGAPPLEVNFAAAAWDDGEIVDSWWEFGDGSSAVHDFYATHTYDKIGTYTAVFNAVDDDGLQSSESIVISVFDDNTVLLIDDDRAYYDQAFVDALNALEVPWAKIIPPLKVNPAIPNVVIWTCGEEYRETLTDEDQDWLAAYLDNRGKLFLSGQDILYDLTMDNGFVRDYLRIVNCNEDIGVNHVRGVVDDPITDGMSIELSHGYRDRSDVLYLADEACGIFTNDDGDYCAMRYDGPEGYKVVFFAFPFEAIPLETGDSVQVMEKILEYLSETGTPTISVSPDSFTHTTAHGAVGSDTIAISNTGDGTLYYYLSPSSLSLGSMRPLAAHHPVEKGDMEPAGMAQTEGAGGPDGYGYLWRDSDQPDGPKFEWIDISEVGQPGPVGDTSWITVDLPFSFPFYGELKDTLTISTDGHATFGEGGRFYNNYPIPDQAPPNDLLAVFWDDLQTGDGAIYYHHDVANDRFIISWVDVCHFVKGQGESLNFQIILYPDGRIIYQYGTMLGYTRSATVGLENSSGTVGLQVVFNAPYVHDNMAVEFLWEPQFLTFDHQFGAVAPGETADVNVGFNAVDLEPGDYSGCVMISTNDPDQKSIMIPAYLKVTPNEKPVIESVKASPVSGLLPLEVTFTGQASDPDGEIVDSWWDFGDGSPVVHGMNAVHTYVDGGTFEAVFHVLDNAGARAAASVIIESIAVPRIGVDPAALNVSAVPGSVAHRSIHIANTGSAPVRFTVGASYKAEPIEMEEADTADTVDPDGVTAYGMFKPLDTPLEPCDIGDVVKSWHVPFVTTAWGCGFDGTNVWVSDWKSPHNWVFTTDGEPTGLDFDTSWAEKWAADLAWDGKLMWQVKVGYDNRIYGLDPATGEPVAVIRDPDHKWDAISQRGLAYDPVEDVFYIGGWNQKILYKIAGLSWSNPGKILREYHLHVSISGIARIGSYLVIAVHSTPDMVMVMDSVSGDIVGTFQHPGGGSNGASGCAADDQGRVWLTYLGDLQTKENANMIYLVDIWSAMMGETPSWMEITPYEGMLDPGESVDVDVAFDTAGLKMGTNYSSCLAVISNAQNKPSIKIPVTFRLDSLKAGFTWVEEEPNTVVFTDTSTDVDGGGVVSWHWDFGDGQTSTEQNPVHKYSENGHYHVRLTVTDADGAVATAEETVILVNTPPVADFSFSISGPLTVEFGDESSDIDGSIVAWTWNFGDGSPSSNEQNPKHVYPAGGSYEVTLAVTDNDGAVATVAKSVELNAPPVVEVLSPTAGEVWIGMHEIRWSAIDPNGASDELMIKLEVSADGGESWRLIADNVPNEGLYEWNSAMVTEGGRYMLRATATNPQGEAGSAVSGEFVIVVLAGRISAVPNPASDLVTFYYDIEADGRLYVYDISGRLVHSAELSAASNMHEWNVMASDRPVASGLYLYVVVTDGGEKSEVGRLVIQR